MQSTATRRVAAPVETVWAVLADHEGMASWAPGMSVALTRDGDDERNGVGAVRRISVPGPAPAIVEEVTAFEAPVRLAYRAIGGVPLKNYAGEVTLAPSGTGTAIRYTVSADERIPVLEQLGTRVIAEVLVTALVRAVGRA